MIPDVTGYPEDCLFDTVFTLPDGSPAQFYSNDCDGVVDLHFSMMADHGIDGAFVQRFYFYPSEEPNGGWNRVCLALYIHPVGRSTFDFPLFIYSSAPVQSHVLFLFVSG